MPKDAGPPGKRPKRGADKKQRPGLPDPSSVVEERTLTSPSGRRYRVMRTTETDPYDKKSPDKDKR